MHHFLFLKRSRTFQLRESKVTYTGGLGGASARSTFIRFPRHYKAVYALLWTDAPLLAWAIWRAGADDAMGSHHTPFEFLSAEPFDTAWRRAVLTREAQCRASRDAPPFGLVSAYSTTNTLYSPKRHVDHLHQRAKSAAYLRRQISKSPPHLRPQLTQSPWFPPLAASLTRAPSREELDAIKKARRRAPPPSTLPTPAPAPFVPKPRYSGAGSLRPNPHSAGWLCKELEGLYAGRQQTNSTVAPAHAAAPPNDDNSRAKLVNSPSRPNFGGVGAVVFGAPINPDEAGKEAPESEKPWASLFRPRAEPPVPPPPRLAVSRSAYDLGQVAQNIDQPHLLGWNYWIAPPGGSAAHFPNQLHPVGHMPPAFT